jgi:hypothetical protein
MKEEKRKKKRKTPQEGLNRLLTNASAWCLVRPHRRPPLISIINGLKEDILIRLSYLSRNAWIANTVEPGTLNILLNIFRYFPYLKANAKDLTPLIKAKYASRMVRYSLSAHITYPKHCLQENSSPAFASFSSTAMPHRGASLWKHLGKEAGDDAESLQRKMKVVHSLGHHSSRLK